jgi:tetratricopeptide (TPR) repeat protein
MISALTSPLLLRRHRRWFFTGAVLLLAAMAFLGWRFIGRSTTDSAELHLNQAKKSLASADFAEAREQLLSTLKRWPLDAETHFLLAQTYRREDDLAGWARHLRVAELVHWPSAEIDQERRLARIQAGNVWQIDPSLVALDGDNGLLFTEALAKGYLASYRIDDLIASTQDWIERRPNDWQPYYLRGQGYLYARLLDRAVNDFRATLERHSHHSAARLSLANALMVDGIYEAARVEYEAYLTNHPDHPEALVGLANCQLNLAQPEAARTTLNRLFAIAPDHPAGCYLLAQLEAAADPVVALDWLRRAERQAPRETDITSALIRVLTQLGREDEAACYQWQLEELRAELLRLDDIRRAVRRDPDRITPRYEAGELCAQLGRTAEALNWFESILAIDPSDQSARRALSKLLQNP